MRAEHTQRASRLETLGAWLGVWTPPRDVAVPPVPWPKVALGAAGLALAVAAVAVFVAPAIDASKERRSAREQRALDRRRAARAAAQRAEQRPRLGRADGSRAAVLATVERRIGEDARARFSPHARRAECAPAAGVDPAGARVAYNCFAGVRDIVGAGRQEGATGTLAIPFRAVVDFGRGRYAFCKTNPPPGEQVIPDPRTIIELPRACRIPRA